MTRTVAQIIQEWREWQADKSMSHADADAELASRINYYVETELAERLRIAAEQGKVDDPGAPRELIARLRSNSVHNHSAGAKAIFADIADELEAWWAAERVSVEPSASHRVIAIAALVEHWNSEGKRVWQMAHRGKRRNTPEQSLIAQAVRFWECARELDAALALPAATLGKHSDGHEGLPRAVAKEAANPAGVTEERGPS